VLLKLTAEDLMTSVGHGRKLLDAIAGLRMAGCRRAKICVCGSASPPGWPWSAI
jgi:hypothetical protein